MLLGSLLLAACSGGREQRTQVTRIDAGDLAEVGVTAFEQITAKTPISTDYAAQSGVRCIVNGLMEGLPESAPDWPWDSQVYDEVVADAFAVPGGSIGVTMGMVEYAGGESELAAALSHEIAHLLLNHSGQRVSAVYSADAAIAAVQTYRGAEGPQQSRTLYSLLGLGNRVGAPMPYTQTEETAAMRPGLELMARAGYDPSAALRLWEKLGAPASGGHLPWLSQHAEPSKRAPEIRAALPELQAIFETARADGKAPTCMNPSS